MKATITSLPPPPKEITLTMSERDARILTAYIGVTTQGDWRKQLEENMSEIEDILPSDFDMDIDLRKDTGYRLYTTMVDAFLNIKS